MLSGRGTLLFFLGASLALHVLALAALPALLHGEEPIAVRVLDVVLLHPTPLPLAEPQSEEVRQAPKPRVQPVAPAREVQRNPPIAATAAAKPDGVPALPPAPPIPAARMETPAAALTTEQPAPAAPTTAPSPAAQPAALLPPVFNAAYLRNPPPRYPLAARRNGEQGTVTLRVLVSVEGMPASVGVEQTSGSRHLDQAALETVRSWRFVPARRGDQAVEAWVLVPIVFRLEGAS